MILDAKADFYVSNGKTKNSEGKSRPTEPTLLLKGIDCNLQFDDGYLAYDNTGQNARSNDMQLYCEDKRVNVIRPTNRVLINGVWYEVEKWIPYSSHTEFLLKELLK